MADVPAAPPESEDCLPTLAHGAIIVRLGRFLDEYVTACDAGLVCGPQTRPASHAVTYSSRKRPRRTMMAPCARVGKQSSLSGGAAGTSAIPVLLTPSS